MSQIKFLENNSADQEEYSRNVIFMDTDQMTAKETKEGHLVINDVESSLVLQVRTTSFVAI